MPRGDPYEQQGQHLSLDHFLRSLPLDEQSLGPAGGPGFTSSISGTRSHFLNDTEIWTSTGAS